MRGVYINCPECRSLMAKNVYQRPGSYGDWKCFNCGSLIRIKAEPGRILTQSLSKPIRDLTDDEEEDIMFIGN